ADNGIGYGFTEHEEIPDICFNYLGDFSGSKTSYFGEYSCGRDVAEGNSLKDKITINGQVADGKLNFIITSQYGQELADKLKEEFEKAVEELAGYCEEKHEEKTASDYGVNDLTTEEFAEMQKDFTGKVEKIYELTPLQAGMLFHNLKDRESTGYVVQSVYITEFEISSENLKEALRLLSKRYEVLRTSFVYEKIREPKQIVYAERVPELEILEVSEEESKRIAKADIKRGFDLSRDTLLRVKSIAIGNGKSKIVLTVHHIIMDGWCMGTLVRKLFKYYFRLEKGEKAEEIEKEISEERKQTEEYSEYIKWLGKQDADKAEKYWEEELEGYDSDCEIKAMGKPEPTEEQMREVFGRTSTEITEKLKAEAERAGSTINTAAETAVGIMLQCYSGSRDVVFGKVVSGRNADIPGIEDMVGLFINTIPVRVKADQEETVEELIKKQQEKGTESTNYDYCSLADIQRKTSQGSELIKVLYVFENYGSGLNEDQGEESEALIKVESGREQTNYGMSILGMEISGKLSFKIMYDPNKYCEEEVQMILERLLKICEEMANKPGAKVCELEAVTEAEKQFILNDFNATETDYPREKTVAELFEEQVKKTPD
uniref:condensation domain-containing protein n=1 Tax=Ruminococcus flavefaciens TaxID=1265 RepID=UPI000564D76F